MANNFSDGQVLLISITGIVDAQGQPSSFRAKPTWASSDPTMLNPVPAADGLSAQGTAQKTGAVTITATGDGVSKSITLNLAAGDVVNFSLTATAIAPPPPPPPPPAA